MIRRVWLRTDTQIWKLERPKSAAIMTAEFLNGFGRFEAAVNQPEPMHSRFIGLHDTESRGEERGQVGFATFGQAQAECRDGAAPSEELGKVVDP